MAIGRFTSAHQSSADHIALSDPLSRGKQEWMEAGLPVEKPA